MGRGDMADLPPEIKAEVEKLKPDRDGFRSREIGNFGRRYDEIISRGFADNPFTPPKERTGGPVKKTPPLSLPTGLRDYRIGPPPSCTISGCRSITTRRNGMCG